MAAREKRKSICLMDTERADTKEKKFDQPMDADAESKHGEANMPKRGRKRNIQQIYKEGKFSLGAPIYKQVQAKTGPSRDTRDKVEQYNAAPDGVRPNSEEPEGAEPNNKEPDRGKLANQEENETRTTNKDKSSIYVPLISQNPTERIITYILDILEVKDEHELFSMPDNLEAYDLGNSMDVPGDFATLRQKHKDGMYRSLEEFKNDVLNVFNKALGSNTPDTIPYQEAKSLQDQANQIFRYLRSNPLYAEKELATWHQKYFKYKKKPAKFETSPGIFRVEILESRLRPRAASNMKQKNADIDDASNRRAQSSLKTKKSPKKRVGSSKSHGKKTGVIFYDPQDFEQSNSPIEDRRNTYKPKNNSFDEIAPMAFQPVELDCQNSTHSYEESLRKFVKDAGPVAKLLAEKKIQELAEQTQAYQASKYKEFSGPQRSSQMPQISDWYRNNKFNADPTNISLPTESDLPGNSASPLQSNRYAAMFDSTVSHAYGTNYFNMCNSDYPPPDNSFAANLNSVQGASCELHTDDLVNWFSKIGTPEFLQGSISNMETSSMGASESALGVNSQLLYGEGSQAVYPSFASSVTSGLMTHTNRSTELKQPEFLQNTMFNMAPSSQRSLETDFGLNSQLFSGERVKGPYPGYASSVTADSMTQITRSSELKLPEYSPSSIFNVAPSSREALLGGNAQLLYGKGKQVAYPSNDTTSNAGFMAQNNSSFDMTQTEYWPSSIFNRAQSSMGTLESIFGGNSQLLSGKGNQTVYPSNASSITAGAMTQTTNRSELKEPAPQTAFNFPYLQVQLGQWNPSGQQAFSGFEGSGPSSSVGEFSGMASFVEHANPSYPSGPTKDA